MTENELRRLEDTNCNEAVWIVFEDGSEGLYYFLGLDEDGDGDFQSIDRRDLSKGDKPFSFSSDYIKEIRVSM